MATSESEDEEVKTRDIMVDKTGPLVALPFDKRTFPRSAIEGTYYGHTDPNAAFGARGTSVVTWTTSDESYQVTWASISFVRFCASYDA